MTNVVTMRGRLCADPDFRQTQNGKAVCSFRLAVERNQKAENGQKQADFISCVCWNQLAEFVSRYFRKVAWQLWKADCKMQITRTAMA